MAIGEALQFVADLVAAERGEAMQAQVEDRRGPARRTAR